MSKNQIKEGQIFAIPLSNDTYTIAQLINKHVIRPSMRKSENTFAFFNIIFSNLEEAKNKFLFIELTQPIAILTANSAPNIYGWVSLGYKPISINYDYKSMISSLGLFKNRATDPSLLLEPYFGLFPWDGYAKDNWIEEKYLLPDAEIRADIKFLKDFSKSELEKLLPPNSPKLLQFKH